MITPDEIKNKVLELADANPDFIYQIPPDEISCRYVHTDGETLVGGCIFGQALIALGVPPMELSYHEGQGISTVINKMPEYFGTDVDQGVLADFVDVQVSQDEQETWGTAVSILRLPAV